jgi:uncharacterized protein YjbJ (UPF0337 family)
MNWDQISGNWKKFEGSAKVRWGKLTDDDVAVVQGRRDQLVGKLQERYGYARNVAEQEIDDWLSADASPL